MESGETVPVGRVQLVPPSTLYSYPRIAEPPFDPAVKASESVAFPGVTLLMVGVPGVVNGVEVTVAELPLPAVFVARRSIV